VAQPTIKQAALAASVRLRHFDIGNIVASIATEMASGKE
jgi:hypothetical protein